MQYTENNNTVFDVFLQGKGELLLQVLAARMTLVCKKPLGGTAVDNATTERTVVSHRNLREKMRIGTKM